MIIKIVKELFARPHRPRSLPARLTHVEVKIEKDLFGWKLWVGKEPIETASEEEARFLRTFLEMGFNEAPLPSDEKTLRETLPALEEAFRRAETKLSAGTVTLLDDENERTVKRMVWDLVRKKVEKASHSSAS